MQRINTANSYAGSRKTGITATEKKLLSFAEEDLKDALQKTNSFFNDIWKPYKEDIERLEISPFKSVRSFDLD